jgi:hypothetical protein
MFSTDAFFPNIFNLQLVESLNAGTDTQGQLHLYNVRAKIPASVL